VLACLTPSSRVSEEKYAVGDFRAKQRSKGERPDFLCGNLTAVGDFRAKKHSKGEHPDFLTISGKKFPIQANHCSPLWPVSDPRVCEAAW
jgi:hypothetical protein